jgi:hypothetical protein
VIFSVVALLGALSPVSAQTAGERWRERLTREAIALFRHVQRPPQLDGRCAIASEWNKYPVDSSTARQYLRSNTHADLVAPHVRVDAESVIGPDGSRSHRFCTNDEWTHFAGQASEAFKNNPEYIRTYSVHRVEYSFPIFNQNFTRAVIVIGYSATGGSRSESGDRMLAHMSGNGGAAVYEKRGGRWFQLTFINYYSFN